MVEHPPTNAGDMGSIRRSGKSSEGEHGNQFQYSCLENPMDRAQDATAHEVTEESDMT